MYDWVNDVNSEPPQAVTTESNTVAESSNPPVAPTKTEVVQSGFPNQLAALASGRNTFPSEQQLNVAAANLPRPVINKQLSSFTGGGQSTTFSTHAVGSRSYDINNCAPATQTLPVPSQTQQPDIPVTTQPLLSKPSSHAVPNLSA